MEVLEKEELVEILEDQQMEEHRKYERRTLRDRRHLWKNTNYKGPERRYHLRRDGKDRRDINNTEDDLIHHLS